MAGSFDFDPYSVSLAGKASQVGVFRYNPLLPSDQRFSLVPNVHCVSITVREGAEPAVARFRYLLDDSSNRSAFPAQFEDLWPMDAEGPYVVRDDERIAVLAFAPSGTARVLFDGFSHAANVDIDGASQDVSFLATSVASRCWDTPIGGRLQRHADDPWNSGVVWVDLPTRFNPDGQPNCTPEDHDEQQSNSGFRFPVFLDPAIDREPDPRTYWTLGKFVRYILAVHNDQRYVRNPDFRVIDALLQARAPRDGSVFLDPSKPGSYQAEDIVIRDFDATNLPWPVALSRQLGYAGFGMRFVIGEDVDGSPAHILEIYRKDGADQVAARDLALPASGVRLDPARCNVGRLSFSRDSRSIANAITVETRQRQIELSIVLAPGFIPSIGDETAANRAQFLRANLSTATGEIRRAYRYYVADEAGDGHWDASVSRWETTALELSTIFPDNDDGEPTYVKRLRPGSYSLLSRDSNGRPHKAQLAISRDYTSVAPGVWDGTGTWQPIDGGWELLPDRLGILVTVEDPEAWAIGDYTGPNPQEPSRTLRGVSSHSNPTASNPRFVLRLTTVIDDDLMLPATVGSRPASPTSFVIQRRVDARDHFRMETIAPRSLYNTGKEAVLIRDDTDFALAHANQLRASHELPSLTGEVMIPSLITAFRVGDRIARVNGRDLSFQTNLGGGQGESPAYPIIVSVTWDFTGQRQATVLRLADRREV